jgi:integrase
MTAYNMAKCRCEHCKASYRIYRAKRRADGKDEQRKPRGCDTDGHIPRAWFRRNVWVPARDAAKLGFALRVHDLRHAHASWLLAGGANLQVVKERLGHATIATTERYLHSLPDADETALRAISKVRELQEVVVDTEDPSAKLKTAEAEIQQLRATVAKLAVAVHLGSGGAEAPV